MNSSEALILLAISWKNRVIATTQPQPINGSSDLISKIWAYRSKDDSAIQTVRCIHTRAFLSGRKKKTLSLLAPPLPNIQNYVGAVHNFNAQMNGHLLLTILYSTLYIFSSIGRKPAKTSMQSHLFKPPSLPII